MSRTGDTALHLAASTGQVEAIRLLLRSSIDASIAGKNGTALDVAKMVKNSEVISALQGANTRMKALSNQRSLMAELQVFEHL